MITALSVLAYVAGLRFKEDARSRLPLFILTLLLGLGYAWTFSGRLGWAAALPFASVVVWANLMPVCLSLTAGLATRSPRLRPDRRVGIVSGLLLMAVAYLAVPLLRPVMAPAELEKSTRWRDDVCLQSHPSSCAPAAAATLLRLHGIDATEAQLAAVCSTSQHGTEPLGLYRGLDQIVRPYRKRPVVAVARPEAWEHHQTYPNISLVNFETTDRAQSEGSLGRLLGPRGEGHAVVVLGRRGSDWLIADPAFGRTVWSNTLFQKRFTGDAIYLVAE